VVVELPAVEGTPTAIGGAGHVGQQDVGVQRRVAGPRCLVPEPGRDETLAREAGDLAFHPTTGRTRGPFEVADSRVDRRLMRFDDLTGHRPQLPQPIEQRYRLRGPEGHVEPRHPSPGQPIIRARRATRENRHQVIGGDEAVEAEQLGAVSEPPARGFTVSGVVVLDACCERQVVVRLARCELPDVQHDRTSTPLIPTAGPPRRRGDPGRSGPHSRFGTETGTAPRTPVYA